MSTSPFQTLLLLFSAFEEISSGKKVFEIRNVGYLHVTEYVREPLRVSALVERAHHHDSRMLLVDVAEHRLERFDFVVCGRAFRTLLVGKDLAREADEHLKISSMRSGEIRLESLETPTVASRIELKSLSSTSLMWLLRTWSRRLTENRNFNITRIIPLLLTIEVVDRSLALFADSFGRSRSGQFSGSFLALELRDVDVNRGQGRIDRGLILEE